MRFTVIGAMVSFALGFLGLSSDYYAGGPGQPGMATIDWFGLRLRERTYMPDVSHSLPPLWYAYTDGTGVALTVGILFPCVAAGAIVGFICWRYTSVARGARERDKKILPLLDPLEEKLAAGEEPTSQEIESLASNPAARSFVYQILKYFERLELFPEDYRKEIAQAEAKLVYWLMHPNELQDAPEEIELVETVNRNIEGRECRFYVFRYRMRSGHWAGDGWLLGLSGPFLDNEPPYSGIAGAFSRSGDKYGKVQPGELVDWFVGMVSE
jgi:hypothetical protein